MAGGRCFLVCLLPSCVGKRQDWERESEVPEVKYWSQAPFWDSRSSASLFFLNLCKVKSSHCLTGERNRRIHNAHCCAVFWDYVCGYLASLFSPYFGNIWQNIVYLTPLW